MRPSILMNKDRSTTALSLAGEGDERFDSKKQGFLSIQEKKVFHISQNWKKFWMVLKQSLIIVGATPRVVLDAYSNETAFLSGASPKQTFNLTGTVAPVAICPQGLVHKQIRHVFAVCPPGSRFLFECDSQFGLESWVDELNTCLFPRTCGTDQFLDDIQSSVKMCGSFRSRTKSNSMNDLSKIGANPIPDPESAPPLPPPNRRQHVQAVTSFPASPTSPTNTEVTSKYIVEIEVSTLPQVPKGVCVILVRKEDIQLCHAVTMECHALWLITHIREFKLTNENKLIITSGHRSSTGYGQIRLKGESCKPLYYKVKVFVQSKSSSKSMNRKLPSEPGVCITLPDANKPKPYQNTSLESDIMSPPGSPSIRSPVSSSPTNYSRPQDFKPPRPLPKIPQPNSPQPAQNNAQNNDDYDRLRFPKQPNLVPLETPYSKLNTDNRWSQGDIVTTKNFTLPTEGTNYSSLSGVKGKYIDQNMPGEYAVTNPFNNAFNDVNKNSNALKHPGLFHSGNDFSTSYSHPKSYETDRDSWGEIRKSKSLVTEKLNKPPKRMVLCPKSSTSPYEEATPPGSGSSDSDTEIDDLLQHNPAYATMDNQQREKVSPYLITQPDLEPKCN